MKQYTNQEIKQNRLKWESALESGKYSKGATTLRDLDDNYCCLGVAADLFAEENGVVKEQHHEYLTYEYNGRFSVAPDYVVSALGLYSYVGNSCNGDNSDPLSTINDDNTSFEPVIEAIKTGNYYKPLEGD